MAKLSSEGVIYIYTDVDQMIASEMDQNARSVFFPILKMGDIVYNDIVNLQRDIFQSGYFTTIKPKLKTAIIYRQFEDDMLPNDFPFERVKIKVNNFGDSIPELTKGNVVVYIARSRNDFELPATAGYKRTKAINNKCFDRQLTFNVSMKNGSMEWHEPRFKEVPYYVMIIYGGKDGLKFTKMVVPSSNYDYFIYEHDLQDEIKKVEINLEDESIKKKRLRLRDEIVKRINEEGI